MPVIIARLGQYLSNSFANSVVVVLLGHGEVEVGGQKTISRSPATCKRSAGIEHASSLCLTCALSPTSGELANS